MSPALPGNQCVFPVGRVWLPCQCEVADRVRDYSSVVGGSLSPSPSDGLPLLLCVPFFINRRKYISVSQRVNGSSSEDVTCQIMCTICCFPLWASPS